MKRLRNILRVEWLMAAFCAWHAADYTRDSGLLHAWRHSPYDRFGWLALALWLVPAVCRILHGADPAGRFVLSLLSLALAVAGVIGDLNFLIYWGLAGVLGALAQVAGRAWLWLALAVCWMPVFGWAGSQLHLSPHTVPVLRLLTAALAAALGLGRPGPPAPTPNL